MISALIEAKEDAFAAAVGAANLGLLSREPAFEPLNSYVGVPRKEYIVLRISAMRPAWTARGRT
jgi:hypothetical protein